MNSDIVVMRFIKFGLVGGSGIIVNELVSGIFLLLLAGSFSPVSRTNISIFFGWGMSVLTNFILNYHWTWKDRKGKDSTSIIHKLSRYYLSATAAYIVQITIVNLLAVTFGWTTIKVLLFNVIGILLGMLINFVLADKWVFYGKQYAHKH